ncbi:MAG: hypothetical protein NTZ39_07910 [Methanoregula sp.]|nr:hypothetical protein [Methanoregula sp.]
MTTNLLMSRSLTFPAGFCTGSTRRRRNAYTIDQDLYKQWSAGGGVWIEDDPDLNTDNTSILPQYFHMCGSI